MIDQDDLKRRAASAAIAKLPLEGTIGLGSGSTARCFIDMVGELVRQGRRYVGVPTSEQSRVQAEALGIPLLGETGPWQIDVTVDGADEVSESFDLIKGGGACHLREKIINDSSNSNIIVVDETKLSRRLGMRFKVPVEVVQFGHSATASKLERFGKVTPRLRDGQRLVTDSGNYLYDVATGEITDPLTLDHELLRIPGVVETGLFIGRASLVIVATSVGIRELSPQTAKVAESPRG